MSKKIKITESNLVDMIQKLVNEDAGMDTPGGNPDYFYGDGSLDKLRKKYGGNYTKDSEEGATYTKDLGDDNLKKEVELLDYLIKSNY